MFRILKVDAGAKTLVEEELNSAYREYGGRGLIAKIMLAEVNPACDPLGAENKLIICTGLLAGTSVPMAHRLSVGGKSPLTGGIKEANVGGTAATALSRHGIKMIVLEGLPKSEEWHFVRVARDGSAELVAADEYAGLNNYQLHGKLKERYGDDISVISIGTAGERQYKNSTLQVTDASSGHPSRAAARGGLGAVMGSKKIKAIVIEKSEARQAFPYADKDLFEKAKKALVQRTLDNPLSHGLMEVGTAATTNVSGVTGMLPVRNFSGTFFDKLDSVSAEAFMQRLQVGGGRNKEGCQAGCIIKCSNTINDAEGNYITSGFEYETIALCGPNCDIGDFDAIARIDRLCDDFGIDTMETGCTIAVCMEAGKIPWGDSEAAIGLIREMMEGTEFGMLLGQGTEAAGKALGVSRIPTVKGQSMAAYDPRNLKGTGLTYATSPMGADHTAGLTLLPGVDHASKTAQVAISSQLQAISAVADCVMCLFGWFTAATAPEITPDLFAGALGGEWTFLRVYGIGAETIMMEKAFNTAAGFTADSDRLPGFFYTDRSAVTGSTFDFSPEEIAQVLNF
ncbi:MAG: aldehyde ferredoxin oxidoreductase [Dethiobacter sp.]|nr:aldehyde ferredoxin oxidoreductase [Dethiobacter sp.]